jgi:hypothetical protein
MPMSYDFPEPTTVLVRARGDVTYAEARRVQEELLADPRLHPGVHMFVDAAGVEKAPSASEIRELALRMPPLLDHGLGPIAIVTDSLFVYGVARMFGLFAEAVHAKVGAFRSADDAERWLHDEAAAA